MTGIWTSYLMAVSAMLFAACSGLTLIYTIKHVDPPDAELPPATTGTRIAA